jgi:TM2 domain-containing membrane protein YozV
LPSLSGIAIALALGWRGVLGASRLRVLSVGWGFAMLALNGLCIYWLLAYLNPTFGPKS